MDLFALSGKLHTDETLLPVLDPGRGRTKSGRLWVYLRDDRPWNGPLPPAAVYYYSPDRSGDHAVRHLAGFTGFLQADAFPGYDQLFTAGRLVEVACMGHARRKFVDLLKARGTPLAEEAVRRIRDLYQIEDKIRGKTAEERQTVRQKEAKPQLAAFKTWMEDNLARLSAKSDIAGAMTYALNNWVALTRYLDDGRLEIDNAAAERSLRSVAVGRKNYLFAGSDGGGERAALVYSLVETCRLNGIEPFAYLCDVIGRIAEHPISRIRELLPYHWTPKPAPVPGLPQPP